MEYPNLEEEKKLWKKGFECVVGLDEVGRGPLAGPVVAGAVFIKPGSEILLKGINDSKKVSEKRREELYNILINHKDIKWGIGIVSEKVIDKINILEATKLAMKIAVEKLSPDYLLLDGNFLLENMSVSQTAIVKGDQKVISISAASIIAKVTRDKMMEDFSNKYPEYGFDRHKGYGTAYHIEMIKKHGPCEIHRLSFAPISEL
jgi:ribonuclease HII